MSKDEKEIARLEARKSALKKWLRSATESQKRQMLNEIVDIDIKIATLRHVPPAYR